RFISVDPVFDTDDPQSMTGYAYCSADPVNCVDLDGRFGWKKFFNKVGAVASVASMIPGPIGTIAGVVSAGAYLAAGNRTEALWAIGGAAAALVGAGALVKGARVAVGVAKAAKAISKGARYAAKGARTAARGPKVVREARATERAIRKGMTPKVGPEIASRIARGNRIHAIAKGLSRPL
ncbi:MULTISPECIES: hypothetical protein, partial [Micromonospora]